MIQTVDATLEHRVGTKGVGLHWIGWILKMARVQYNDDKEKIALTPEQRRPSSRDSLLFPCRHLHGKDYGADLLPIVTYDNQPDRLQIASGF